MRKYYIGIGILILFNVILAGILFSFVGSPLDLRARQFDQTRLADFASLDSNIQTFYTSNKRLPVTLNELKTTYTYITINDPESHDVYDYKLLPSQVTYQLCTVFSAESKTEPIQQNYSYPGALQPKTHKKGYDCMTYTLPAYVITQNPVLPGNVNPTPVYSYPTFEPTSTIAPAPTSPYSSTYSNMASQEDLKKFRADAAIIAPKQGEVLCLGQKYTIQWRVPEDDVQGITLKIAKPENGDTIQTIGSFPSTYNTNKQGYGSYTWIVGDTQNSNLIPGPAYHIFLQGDYHGWGLLSADSLLFTINTCSKNQ